MPAPPAMPGPRPLRRSWPRRSWSVATAAGRAARPAGLAECRGAQHDLGCAPLRARGSHPDGRGRGADGDRPLGLAETGQPATSRACRPAALRDRGRAALAGRGIPAHAAWAPAAIDTRTRSTGGPCRRSSSPNRRSKDERRSIARARRAEQQAAPFASEVRQRVGAVEPVGAHRRAAERRCHLGAVARPGMSIGPPTAAYSRSTPWPRVDPT